MVRKAPVVVIFLILAQLSTVGRPAANRAQQAIFDAECVGITDGDTVTVLRGNRQIRIRLEGIDCPELHQNFGTRAKQFSSNLLFGRKVTVNAKYLDRNGRTVARVNVGDKDASVLLVEAGLAWHYRRYSSDPILAKAEQQARALKKGLWSEPRPMPPWDWRRANPRSRAF